MKIHFFILLLWLISLGVVYAEEVYSGVKLKPCHDVTDSDECINVSLLLNLSFFGDKKTILSLLLVSSFLI